MKLRYWKKQNVGRERIFLAFAILLSCSFVESSQAKAVVTAIKASDFLNSIGTLSAISVRGENLQKTGECTKYLGVRWLRAGIEGDVPLEHFAFLHAHSGLRFSWGLGSGSSDIPKLIETARKIGAMGALLAFEGPNEPNNWGIVYQGESGGKNGSWLPVAKLQRDLYQAVKKDPSLKKYPVWSISEGGAEVDNAGLQFLVIPQGARTLMPEGTRYADFANVHNYIYHPASSGLTDNKTWNAADPGPGCKVDGLYVEYGVTWGKHFQGYSAVELDSLPRVTTETGTTIGDAVTEEIHALNLMSMYLDQFKRGWSHTAVYLLRDRVDEGGNQKFAFYTPDYTPRRAATYLHNLTTILNDDESSRNPDSLDYSVSEQPSTVHEMLLQKSNGLFDLIVWSELLKGANTVSVRLAKASPLLKIYDPTTGTAPVRTLTNTETISLTLSDHPVILEF